MDYKTAALELLKEKFDNIRKDRLMEIEKIQKWSNEPGHNICIFGAGSGGKAVSFWYAKMGIKIDFYCDNDEEKWGKTLEDGKMCISLEELTKVKENTLCVISIGTKHLESVYSQLKALGAPHIVRHTRGTLLDAIINSPEDFKLKVSDICTRLDELFDILEDEASKKIVYFKLLFWMQEADELNQLSLEEIYTGDQYFIKRGKFLKNKETIADCGAFDGDTLDYLIHNIGYTGFKKYICMEPDCENFKRLKKRVSSYSDDLRKRVVLYPFGVGKERKKEDFGEIMPLDQLEEQREITMLKMDIEGFEMDALEGAKNIISENKPFCAICVYHKFSDIWEIPLYLKRLVPEYHIALRHHQYSYSETVCYAFLKESEKSEQTNWMERV